MLSANSMPQARFESEDCEELKLNSEHSTSKNHGNVFQVYRGADDFKHAGIFKGGLDVGVDPNLLSVNLNSEENLLERMKSPFSSPLNLGQTVSSRNQLDA